MPGVMHYPATTAKLAVNGHQPPHSSSIGSFKMQPPASLQPSADLPNGSHHLGRAAPAAPRHSQEEPGVSAPRSPPSYAPRTPPSYLSIACAVGGYSPINRYDSAVREGFRSRDASPAPPRLSFTRSRDSSPLRERLRSPESKSTPQETAVRISELKAQLARCALELGGQIKHHTSRQNSIRRRDAKPPSGRSVSVDRGYLTKANLVHTGASYTAAQQKASSERHAGYDTPDASSINYINFNSSSGSAAQRARQGYFNISSGNMTSQQIPVRLIDAQPPYNGHIGSPLTLHHSHTIDNIDTRSFIQERIERLYGPGALAAGFIRRSPSRNDSPTTTNGSETTSVMGNTVKRTPTTRTEGRVIPIQLEYGPLDKRQDSAGGGEGMPSVFRHLRPEFRHQLPVKSPVSGSGQSIPVKSTDLVGSVEGNGVTSPTSNGISSPQSRPAASIVPAPIQTPRSQASIVQTQPNTDLAANTTSNNNSNNISNIKSPIVGSSTHPVKLNGSTGKVWDNLPEVSARVLPDERSDASPALSSPHNRCSSTSSEAVSSSSAVTAQDPLVKDGHYFLKIVADNVSRLEAEVAEMESELERNSAAMTEEVAGKVFAGTGKTKLLISQKIKQFIGLCHKNIAGQTGTDEFPTTCADLAGFWDMVSLQVEEVQQLLAQLRRIKENNWKELPPVDTANAATSTKTTTKLTRRVKPTPPSAASKAKEEARKKAMEDRRNAMREAMKAKRAAGAAAAKSGDSDTVEIFVVEK